MATKEIAPSAVQADLQQIPLAALFVSPTNPRQTYEAKALQDLVINIRAMGLIEPLVVRPDKFGDRYEVVAGNRRLKALQILQRTEAPCIVRTLEDREVLEIQISENLQRQDVHPLEEADGFRSLLQLEAEDSGEEAFANDGRVNGAEKACVEALAKKVGKSLSYIYQRLKLGELIPLAKDAFRRKLISAGHAILIARLIYHDQLRALAAVFDSSGYFDGKINPNVESDKLTEIVRERLKEYEDAVKQGEDDDYRMSEKRLREWIQDNVNLDLKSAPWKLDDPDLVPSAGACTNCLKHTQAAPLVYQSLGDKKHDYCMDSFCFSQKRKALVELKLKTSGDKPALQLDARSRYAKPKEDQKIYFQGQWVPAKKGSCPDTQPGVIVRGEDSGESKTVCVNPKCKVHKHYVSDSSPRSRQVAPQWDWEKERKEREQKRDRENALRRRIGAAIIEKVDTMGSRELKMLGGRVCEAGIASGRDFFKSQFNLTEAKILESLQTIKAGSKLWTQIAIAAVISDKMSEWDPEPKNRKSLLAVAKAYGVDAGKIIAEFEAEQKQAVTTEKSAAKKGGRK